MNLRKVFTLLLVLCILFFMASCGGGGGSSSADNGGADNGGGEDNGDSAPAGPWLCFTADGGNVDVKIVIYKALSVVPSLEWSSDAETWNAITIDNNDWTTTPITTLSNGKRMYIRATTTSGTFSESDDNFLCFEFDGSGKVKASGNIMSLLDKSCASTTIPNEYCFICLFSDCEQLISAPELPATTLTVGCYEQMFHGCTNLATAPALPAESLFAHCYDGMFMHCTALTIAPELPATTLAESCYEQMFYYCTNLITAPGLPATTLSDYCYCFMFQNCTSLAAAPELPATTLADYCYCSMFENCTNLTTAPALPATTLVDYCYYSMFDGCSSLITAPELPAETLVEGCYGWMFNDCTSLTSITVHFATAGWSVTDATDNWVYGVTTGDSSRKFHYKTGLDVSTKDKDHVPDGWDTIQF